MIYFDSAATSLLKPDSVKYAVIEAMGSMGSPGRGSHTAALKAADACFECRENAAKLFNVSDPERIVFTFNATHGLNIAISSAVKRDMKVLVSGYEHNSVIRPLHAAGADVTVVRTELFEPEAMLEEFKKQIPNSDAAVFTHVSNVFGYILPIAEMAKLCREYDKPFIIDASQSAGILDIDFERLGAAFVAMPGHKGLMGPQGTGLLLCRGTAEPLMHGGSGSNSSQPFMPDFLPDRLEAGTHNVAGIAGMNAGIKYILRNRTQSIAMHERALLDAAASELSGIKGIRYFYSPDDKRQSGVMSIVPELCGCDWLGEILSENGVAVRTGLQCAPCAHITAGTIDTGTVRISFSPFNTTEEVGMFGEILRKIIKNI